MSEPQPWWASPASDDGSRPGELRPDEDPLDEHLAGRRGGSDEVSVGADADRAAAGDPSGGPANGPDICGVCPICATVRLLGDTRPELLAHLTEAARHLAAAARTLLEPTVADAGEAEQATDGRIHRIDLES